jgi:hypothetical protein
MTTEMDVKTKAYRSDFFEEVEDCGENCYIELKDLSIGDIFYECSPDGINYELQAISEPYKSGDGWKCRVKNTLSGEELVFYVSSSTSYRGINLFRAPMNLTKNDKGKYIYLIQE